MFWNHGYISPSAGGKEAIVGREKVRRLLAPTGRNPA